MAHTLPRLSKSLLETPQLITPSKFKEIAEVLENRELAFIDQEKTMGLFDLDDDKEDNGFSEKNNYGIESLGILRVEGATSYKPTGYEALCGTGCSYTGLLTQMEEFVNQGKKKVLMKVDSPGGQAFRMMFTARELRRMADENGIELVAYVDGMAASAGLGLCVAAHTVVANEDSDLGSVGVIISLLDSSKAENDAGYKRVYITAGSEKVPFDKEGGFKDSFLADLQGKVEKLYDKFTSHVAEMRNIDVQVVRDTEARMFDAQDAVELGFADKIMEEPEFLEWFLGEDYKSNSKKITTTADASAKPQSFMTNTKTKEVNLMTENVIVPEASVETELATKLAEMQAALDAKTAQLSAYEEKETEAAKAALSSDLDNKPFLAECKESLVEFFMSADVDANLKTLMNTVIDSANASMVANAEEAKANLEKVTVEAKAEVEAKEKELLAAKAEAEAVKEEFATTSFAETTETKELNVQLSHKEKIAKAVAAEKAKLNK